MYNTFAVSILQFYLQFYGVTDELRAMEAQALRVVFKGPGHWIPREVITGLKGQLGACFGVMEVEKISRAAKLRLILTEPNLYGKDLQGDIRKEWAKGEHYLQGNAFPGQPSMEEMVRRRSAGVHLRGGGRL